jgi:hypothetical protein
MLLLLTPLAPVLALLLLLGAERFEQGLDAKPRSH